MKSRSSETETRALTKPASFQRWEEFSMCVSALATEAIFARGEADEPHAPREATKWNIVRSLPLAGNEKFIPAAFEVQKAVPEMRLNLHYTSTSDFIIIIIIIVVIYLQCVLLSQCSIRCKYFWEYLHDYLTTRRMIQYPDIAFDYYR